MPFLRSALFLATLGVALGAGPARADAPQAPAAPSVALQADHLDVDVAASRATLTGRVSLARGDLTLACPRLDVKFDPMPHVVWARGSGGVVAVLAGVHAEAPTVELDLARQAIDLQGGVRVTRGAAWVTADSARFDLATSRLTLEGVRAGLPVPPSPPSPKAP